MFDPFEFLWLFVSFRVLLLIVTLLLIGLLVLEHGAAAFTMGVFWLVILTNAGLGLVGWGLERHITPRWKRWLEHRKR